LIEKGFRRKEYSPEKAGVGGSTPSLASIFFNSLRASLPEDLGAIGCKKPSAGIRLSEFPTHHVGGMTKANLERRTQCQDNIWCDVDVLASDPPEMNQISARLRQPSSDWTTKHPGQDASKDETKGLRDLFDCEMVTNLGPTHPSLNKARRFGFSFKDKCSGFVRGHLLEVSECFPQAIFLVDYRDMEMSCSAKQVVCAGEVIRSISDGNERSPLTSWALPDIFAPFRTEYYAQFTDEYDAVLPFGSLWKEWLGVMTVAVRQLGDELGDALP
jgi:hypothetical protein